MSAAWPPEGWVTGDDAARMLGVSIETFRTGKWRWRTRLRSARCIRRPDGRRSNIYPVEEIERIRAERAAMAAEREANRHAPFPPPGFVDRGGAAALLGIGMSTLNVWIREGRLGYAGTLAMGPNGVQCRVYAIEELARARQAMTAADAARRTPPEGFVDHDGAARFFGVHPVTVTKWQREGGLGRGTWMDVAGGGKRRKVFAVAELECARKQMRAAASRPTAPEGYVELHEAARVLGVHPGTLRQWECQGRLTKGRVVPIPGTSARTKVYRGEELRRLREEIRIAAAKFPPAGWIDLKEAARRAQVSAGVWKRWCQAGRVTGGRWVTKPTGGRCKLFDVEEVGRVVEELGRDHSFFMEPDGQGGWRPPAGYVDRGGAARMFGVAERTMVSWQTEGRITCGRWARMPVGESGGRRVYPVEELCRLVGEFDKVGRPYPDADDPGIVRVPIMSWSKTRFEAIIDSGDLPLIEGKRWNWMPRSDEDGAVVVLSAPAGGQTPLRRIILGLRGPLWRISHRNGDPLDCRRANLIVRNVTEQLAHSRKRKTVAGRPCTSRFKGVSWLEKRGKWCARISKEGVTRRLGNFDDELAAAEAYDEAARDLFGEHARLNFPDGVDARLEREAELLPGENRSATHAAPGAARPADARAA